MSERPNVPPDLTGDPGNDEVSWQSRLRGEPNLQAHPVRDALRSIAAGEQALSEQSELNADAGWADVLKRAQVRSRVAEANGVPERARSARRTWWSAASGWALAAAVCGAVILRLLASDPQVDEPSDGSSATILDQRNAAQSSGPEASSTRLRGNVSAGAEAVLRVPSPEATYQAWVQLLEPLGASLQSRSGEAGRVQVQLHVPRVEDRPSVLKHLADRDLYLDAEGRLTVTLERAETP